MRVVLAIILLSLLVGDIIARSKHPTPSTRKYESRIPQANTENGQQPSAADQRGTEQSPIIVKIIGAEPKAQNRASDNTDDGQKKSPTDWWNVAIGGGTLFVLGLQLIAFTAQACYMRRTVTEMQSTTRAAIRAAKAAEGTLGEMRNTAERQLRAYVWGVTIQNKNIDADQFIAQTNIKNTGQTPAYDVCSWNKLKPYENPLAADFIFESAPEKIIGSAKYVVNAGSEHCINVGIEPFLTIEDKAAIKAGVKSLYRWGEIQYRDEFAQDRRTRFRLVWVHEPSQSVGSWSYCDEGNDAT